MPGALCSHLSHTSASVSLMDVLSTERFFPELSNSCLNWIFCQKREKRPTYFSPSPTSPFPVNVLTLPLRRPSWKSYTQPLLHS